MQLMNLKLTVAFAIFFRYNNFQNAFYSQHWYIQYDTLRLLFYFEYNVLTSTLISQGVSYICSTKQVYKMYTIKMINCLPIVFSGHHWLRQMLVRQTPIRHHFRQKPRFGRETRHGWPSRKGQCWPSSHLSCSKFICHLQ